MHELAHTIRNPKTNSFFFGRGGDNADEGVTMLMAIWVRHFPLRVVRGDRGKRHVYLTKVTPPASQHPDRLIFPHFR